MQETQAITVRTSEKNILSIDKIARLLDRSRNYLINEAIKSYIKTHQNQLKGVKLAMNEVKTGKTHSFEAVFEELEKDL
jgi:predicted transcriptional regulator